MKAVGKLTLRADGTFTAVEMPGELLLSDPISGSGEWTLLGDRFSGWWEGGQTLRLRFSRVNDVQTDLGYQLIALAGRTSPKLFYFSDDPDLGKRIYFSKGEETQLR